MKSAKELAMEEGRAEGLEEGRAEGRAETNRLTAINLLRMNFEPVMVAGSTGLSMEEINALKAAL